MSKIALGTDDFIKYRKKQSLYIDKSLFIRDIIDSDEEVLLITRPRRFGKTLNMTMLKSYFDIEKGKDNYEYFKDLKIWQCEEEYKSQLGKYPVIFMSLKDIESNNWEDCYDGLKLKIADVFRDHRKIIVTLDFRSDRWY